MSGIEPALSSMFSKTSGGTSYPIEVIFLRSIYLEWLETFLRSVYDLNV
jgi:hypothetical protein